MKSNCKITIFVEVRRDMKYHISIYLRLDATISLGSGEWPSKSFCNTLQSTFVFICRLIIGQLINVRSLSTGEPFSVLLKVQYITDICRLVIAGVGGGVWCTNACETKNCWVKTTRRFHYSRYRRIFIGIFCVYMFSTHFSR